MLARLFAPTVEVSAHCDLPCGVYDPAQARIEAESIKGIIGKVADNDDADLHYSQPTVSHHLARLEAETGAQLLQRVGRGIRLTEAGRLLADRATEIVGRIDAADAELAGYVGLTAGRVRLAGFSSAIGSL